MKNWDVALSTTLVRAMATVPRALVTPLVASFLMAERPLFWFMSESKPPPWIMKVWMTR